MSDFYKSDKKPYIISYINQLSPEKIDDTVDYYLISVRIEDSAGEYFQHIHVIKENGKFYIDNIENDI